MAATYALCSFSVPEAEEEVLTAELWSHGTLGLEVVPSPAGQRLRIDAYFSADRVPSTAQLARWCSGGVELHEVADLPAQDWLASYRAHARPLELGTRFRVDPRERPDALPALGTEGSHAPQPGPGADGRFALHIPARTAFGTGSHASTRLLLTWLEDVPLAGLRVLDVGTGSGILAFGAKLLGAQRVVALDIDAQAVCVARSNGRRNRVVAGWLAGSLAALRPAPRFDLVLVNILPERIRDDLPRLGRLLRPGGQVLSSGNLWRDRAMLEARFLAAGLHTAARRRDGEWVAFRLRVGAPGTKGAS